MAPTALSGSLPAVSSQRDPQRRAYRATALEGAGERGYEFPRWFPVQIVREEGREDELLARMGRAQRGELSAEDEARTRDAYARWKMRRAGRG